MGLTEFEQQVYSRLKPLAAMGVAITPRLTIRVREPNKFFPRGRSWRYSLLCTKGESYALIDARCDFSNEWLMQLELLSLSNPAALQNLIVVCPASAEKTPALAHLIVIPDQAIAFHLADKFR